MKETYRLLPVYAGDVSGIASALYELGGMVVIHDPSGCNSTYNTHDELRWYETESNIFISGLNMRDAVLGNDKKFIADILEAADGISPAPAFIAICNSPVPFLNGTDFAGICRIVERETGIPAFYVPSNGMYDYVTGISRAFLAYAKKLLPDRKQLEQAEKSRRFSRTGDESAAPRDLSVNLLGLTPLSFSHKEAVPSLVSLLESRGFSVNAVWAMGEKAKKLFATAEADVNLVVSETALPLAGYLEEIYGTPYVVGCPVSKDALAATEEALKDAAKNKKSGKKIYESFAENRDGAASSRNITSSKATFSTERTLPTGISAYIGEAVLSSSLAAFAAEGTESLVLCPFEGGKNLLGSNGRFFTGEEGFQAALQEITEMYPGQHVTIHADPMYGLLLPDAFAFVPEPVLAMSGREFRGHYINYFDRTKF